MHVTIVTGSAGLVGAETARFYLAKGHHVVGIDNDMRARFFGPEASTAWQRERLCADYEHYEHASRLGRYWNALVGVPMLTPSFMRARASGPIKPSVALVLGR